LARSAFTIAAVLAALAGVVALLAGFLAAALLLAGLLVLPALLLVGILRMPALLLVGILRMPALLTAMLVIVLLAVRVLILVLRILVRILVHFHTPICPARLSQIEQKTSDRDSKNCRFSNLDAHRLGYGQFIGPDNVPGTVPGTCVQRDRGTERQSRLC
jgi:hypothetical protein